MTPNQITSTADALRALLQDGHRQGLTPLADSCAVRYDRAAELAYVVTNWVEPEGDRVSLRACVSNDGTATPQPAQWPDAGRPGVKVLGDGQAYYSAAWLDENDDEADSREGQYTAWEMLD